MNDEDLVSGCVLILAVATIYLLMAGVAIAMARDGLVLWEDASAAVEAISTFATLTVGAVVIAHSTSGRAKAEKKSATPTRSFALFLLLIALVLQRIEGCVEDWVFLPVAVVEVPPLELVDVEALGFHLTP